MKVKPIEQQPKRGRPVKEELIKAILQCTNQGLTYVKAKPVLASLGFVNEDGECSVSQRVYEYTRLKDCDQKTLTIKLPSSSYEWIISHKEEFLELIATKARESKE